MFSTKMNNKKEVLNYLEQVVPKSQRLDFANTPLHSTIQYGADEDITRFFVPLEKYLATVQALQVAEKFIEFQSTVEQ